MISRRTFTEVSEPTVSTMHFCSWSLITLPYSRSISGVQVQSSLIREPKATQLRLYWLARWDVFPSTSYRAFFICILFKNCWCTTSSFSGPIPKASILIVLVSADKLLLQVQCSSSGRGFIQTNRRLGLTLASFVEWPLQDPSKMHLDDDRPAIPSCSGLARHGLPIEIASYRNVNLHLCKTGCAVCHF